MELYLDAKQREDIGYKYVIERLNIHSVYGKELLIYQQPYQDQQALTTEFDRIELVKTLITNNNKVFKETEVYLSRFKNIDSIIDSLEIMVLDEVEIFEIKKFIFNINKMNVNFSNVENLPDYFQFFDFNELFAYLDQDNSMMPFFHLYDQYSNELKDLRIELKAEKDETKHEKIKELIKEQELAIRTQITKNIYTYQQALKDSTKQLGYLDLLIAKATMALKYDLNKPSFSNIIELNQAFNPMVLEIVTSKGYDYTKMDIDIENKVSLLTGSNMSGKSVSLKNLLLNTLLFQYGFYPFAKEAKLPLLNFILYISDELQDVQNSLSSFGMEVHVLNQALEIVNKVDNGLIVLDEFARGTNPIEAKKIVTGLINYLDQKQVFAVLSTHLELKLDLDYNHFQVKGLDECDFECQTSEDIQRVMDYSLKRVDKSKTVPYDAFKVMNFLNMDSELKKYIEKEYTKGE